MHPLIANLLMSRPVIVCGAIGTELQAQGLALGACADAWNLSHIREVEHVSRQYVQAGCRILLTNTFGANRINLGVHGLADSVAQINRGGAEIARGAAKDAAMIFGCVGPVNKAALREQAIKTTPAEALSEAIREQAIALASAGVDALVIETMTSVYDAEQSVYACKETGLPIVACVSFPAQISSELSPELVVERLAIAGVDVIGANCGYGPTGFIEICRRMRRAAEIPIWIKPSAGLPQIVQGRPVYSLTPEEFAEDALQIVEAGADFIGGCCGIGPSHIRALAGSINQ